METTATPDLRSRAAARHRPDRRSLAVLVLLSLLASVLGTVLATGRADASGPHQLSGPGTTVPDYGRSSLYPSYVNAGMRGRSLTGLQVHLYGVNHGCVKDLDVLLVGPNGQSVVLMSDNGDQATTPFSCYDIHSPTLTFDDSCPEFPNPISNGARQNPGQDICARPSDNDNLGHNGDNWLDVNGDFTAHPLSDFNGTDPSGTWRLYVIDDASGDSGSIAGWDMVWSTSDQPPTATPQTVNVYKGVGQQIAIGGTDPDDGESRGCQILGQPAKGSVPVDQYGYTCWPTYTANALSTGQDRFPFKVFDLAGQESAPAYVTLNIVNRSPSANPVDVTVKPGQSVALPFGGSDPDPQEGVTCGSITDPHLGTISGSGCARTYTAGSQTGLDTFSYTVYDPFGAGAIGQVQVHVVSTAPTADAKQATVNKGEGKTITLTGTNPGGGSLTCNTASLPSKGVLGGTGCSRTYTANAKTSGRDTFTYTVTNTSGEVSAPATVTLDIANRAPTGKTGTLTLAKGQSATLPFGGTDPDPQETVRCFELSKPTLGTYTGGTDECSPVFTAGQATGTETLRYSVADPFGVVGTGSLQLTVVDDQPVATPKAASSAKGGSVTVQLGGTDPTGGTLTCQAPNATVAGKGTLTGAGCTRTFTPANRTSGQDSFTYTVKSSNGKTSAPATVTLTITNRAPVAITVNATVSAGDRAALQLAGLDEDPGETPSLTCSVQPGNTAKGSVKGTGCNITYTAGSATGEDTIRWVLSDGFGGTTNATAHVTITDAAPAGCTKDDGANARYVCRTYTDLLGRTAEPSGKAYWVARLDKGENRTAIITSFMSTAEYRGSVVRDIYWSALGTAPSASALASWSDQLKKGLDPDAIRRSVYGSAAYQQRTGGTAEGFAAGLYQQVLRRPATAAEAKAVADQLDAGTSRETVAQQLLRTTEGDASTVAAIYERFLRRSPPSSETTYWVGRLQQGDQELSLVKQIIASAEYYGRA